MTYSCISVVTVVLNRAKTIERTILSVLNQVYDNIEYIIIDGASTDGTVDIIKNYDERIKNGEFPNITFRWISEVDKGIYDAMNKGIDMASGEWINFMNAGDYFYNNNVLLYVHNQPDTVDYDIVYGDTIIFSPVGEYLKKARPLSLMPKLQILGHQSTFIKTTLMKEVKYDTMFKSAGDYNFFYHCYMQNKRFLHIPVIVAAFEEGLANMSANYTVGCREAARIRGIEHKIGWKISFVAGYIWFLTRKILKRIFPDSITYRIRKGIIIYKRNIYS